MKSSQDKVHPLEKPNAEVMGSYGKDQTVVGRRIEKVAISLPTCFPGIMMCMYGPF